MNPRIFTIEEANALLPQINVLLVRLQEKKKQIDLKQIEIDLMEIVKAVPQMGGRSPSMRAGQQIEELNSMVEGYTHLFEEIESLGPVIKDVDHGLVDFYHVRDQQLVFLCWKQGEQEISFWHDLESGYSGRQSL